MSDLSGVGAEGPKAHVDESIWRLCGSNRKSEVCGREWKELQKGTSFRWIHGRFHYFDGSSNYFDGRFHQLGRLFFFIKKIILRFEKLAKIVRRQGGVLSQNVKFNRGQNTRKVHFYKFREKKTGQARRCKSKREKVRTKYMLRVVFFFF